MINYKEPVKDLRDLANGRWKNSEYTWFGDEGKVFANAAAAIEELEVEVYKANKSAEAYRTMYFTKHGEITIEKVRELDEIDCHFHSALIRIMYKRIGELKAEVKRLEPKRGEWEQVGDNTYKCTNCGEISCCKGKYCPDCGAKMEAQE